MDHTDNIWTGDDNGHAIRREHADQHTRFPADDGIAVQAGRGVTICFDHDIAVHLVHMDRVGGLHQCPGCSHERGPVHGVADHGPGVERGWRVIGTDRFQLHLFSCFHCLNTIIHGIQFHHKLPVFFQFTEQVECVIVMPFGSLTDDYAER